MTLDKAIRKHQVTLSDEELKALKDRLVPISPIDYDLKAYAILRNLYGRFEHILLAEEIKAQKVESGRQGKANT